MLKKLLEKVNYNPGIVSQISFYSRRMRQETQIRRLGLIFIVLAFMIQFFAFISPPQATVADSPNDLVNGGFNSSIEAANYCNSNVRDYGVILANYSITCSEVKNSTVVTLNSDDYNRQLFSMGRNPYGLKGETPVVINKVTYYFRYLWAWDTMGSSNYQALRVISSDQKTYFLLFNCGNLVSIGLPKSPDLTISKTTTPGYPLAGSELKPNQIVSYRILVNNTGGVANNVVVTDNLPNYTTMIAFDSKSASSYPSNLSSSQPTWKYDTVSQKDNYFIDLKVKIDGSTPNNTRICNRASVSSSNTNSLDSNQICMTVLYSTPTTPITPTTPTQPTVPTVSTCQYNSSLPSTSPDCKPCQDSINSQDALACIKVSKTASNLTQGISNANGTTAQAGDEIVYTLYAANTGQATVSNYIFSENLNSVLTYSDIENLYGGKLDSSNQISWPAINIPAGQTAFEKVEVKVKNPIPQTPTSSSDPGYFNLQMVNVYGNSVTINLPPSAIKTIENISTTSTTLVNTGPGTDIFIAAIVVTVFGYFFSRSRILAKESAIAISNMSN